jgi:hypothetical protein
VVAGCGGAVLPSVAVCGLLAERICDRVVGVRVAPPGSCSALDLHADVRFRMADLRADAIPNGSAGGWRIAIDRVETS